MPAAYAQNLQSVPGIDPTGATDCGAALAGLARGHYQVPAGTYLVSSAAPLAAGVLLECAEGAVFEITGSGYLDFSLARTPVADPDQPIFDVSAMQWGDSPVRGLRYASLKWFGAAGDVVVSRTGTMAAASAVLDIAEAAFTAQDVGKPIEVRMAGSDTWDTTPGGKMPMLTTSIAQVNSATQVVLALAATNAVSGEVVLWGTADDRPVMAAANSIHATLGGELFVPAGGYLRTAFEQVYLRAGTTLRGAGRYVSSLHRRTGAYASVIDTAAGARAVTLADVGIDLTGGQDYREGIRLDSTSGFTAERCRFFDTLYHAGNNWTQTCVHTRVSAVDLRVLSCDFEQTQLKGAGGGGTGSTFQDIQIRGNRFNDGAKYGISLTSGSNGIIYRNVSITHNIFRGAFRDGCMHLGVDGPTVYGGTVEGWDVSHNLVQASLLNSGGVYISMRLGQSCRDVTLSHNVIRGEGGADYGIHVVGGPDYASGARVVVNHNLISTIGIRAIDVSAGGDVEASFNHLTATRGIRVTAGGVTGAPKVTLATLAENRVDGAGTGSRGLWVENVPRFALEGNVVRNCNVSSGSGAVLVTVDSGFTSHGRVHGNRIFDDQAAKTQTSALEEAIAGTYTRDYQRNDLRGNGATQPLLGMNPLSDGRGIWLDNHTDYAAYTAATLEFTHSAGAVNPASLAAGAQQLLGPYTVTGAAMGDLVQVSHGADAQGTTWNGYVSAANTVSVVHRNGTAAAVDVASGTLRFRILRY